jgi:hypothetical protein
MRLPVLSMKNVQVIDGAINSVFEIYAIPDDVFVRLFPNGTDVAFAEDFSDNDSVWTDFYKHRIDKKSVRGIDGTLHLFKKAEVASYFPTRKEAEVK